LVGAIEKGQKVPTRFPKPNQGKAFGYWQPVKLCLVNRGAALPYTRLPHPLKAVDDF